MPDEWKLLVNTSNVFADLALVLFLASFFFNTFFSGIGRKGCY